CWLRGGWAMPTRAAARLNPSSSATATKYHRWRSSISGLISMTSHFILTIYWTYSSAGRIFLSVVTLRALGRLLAAHPILGAGIALVVQSGLGAAPWDVFHVGLHRATGLSVGAATMVTGVCAVLLALFAGVRPGFATLA